MTDTARHASRTSIPIILVVAILSAMTVFAATSFGDPGDVAGATTTKAAACKANLRGRPTTSSRLRTTIAANTRVTVVAKVSGGRWSVKCGGGRTGRNWYRISEIAGQSVRSRFGVNYVYAAAGLIKAVAASPTIAPTPRPPAPVPTAPVPAGCGTSLQTLINSTPTGGTLDVPDCLYRETVTISRAMTVDGAGATIDGRDSAGVAARQRWMFVNANDVTVRGFRMQYTSGGHAVGGVETASGVQRFVLEDCDVSHAYVNINLTGATDSVIRHCAIHDASHLAIRVAANAPHGGKRNLIAANLIYHNNRTHEPDPYADSGGIKVTWQDDLVLDANQIYDNGARGVWLDGGCLNTTISNNKVHHNDGPGIMDETGTGTRIFGNATWENGFVAGAVWGWGAGILISSAKNAEIWNNTVAWNYAGISVISQNRSDSPGVTGISIHDNKVMAEQPVAGQDRYGLFWGQDWAGPMYVASSNNRGTNNSFWYPAPENQYARFIWDGYRTMASFVTTPGGAGSRWLTTAEKTAALTAAGIPASP